MDSELTGAGFPLRTYSVKNQTYTTWEQEESLFQWPGDPYDEAAQLVIASLEPDPNPTTIPEQIRLDIAAQAEQEGRGADMGTGSHHTGAPCRPLLPTSHRYRLVVWMREVSGALGLNSATTFEAVFLLDRFVGTTEALPHEGLLQLLALACMSVAVKFHEVGKVAPALWLGLAVGPLGVPLYKARDLQRMEWNLLHTIGWNMRAPNTYTFLTHYLACVLRPPAITCDGPLSTASPAAANPTTAAAPAPSAPNRPAAAAAAAAPLGTNRSLYCCLATGREVCRVSSSSWGRSKMGPEAAQARGSASAVSAPVPQAWLDSSAGHSLRSRSLSCCGEDLACDEELGLEDAAGVQRSFDSGSSSISSGGASDVSCCWWPQRSRRRCSTGLSAGPPALPPAVRVVSYALKLADMSLMYDTLLPYNPSTIALACVVLSERLVAAGPDAAAAVAPVAAGVAVHLPPPPAAAASPAAAVVSAASGVPLGQLAPGLEGCVQDLERCFRSMTVIQRYA